MTTLNLNQLANLGLGVTGQSLKVPGQRALPETLPVVQIARYRDFQITVIQLPMQNAPANLFNNSGARYQAVIQRGAVSRIKHLVVKMDVTVTGSASVLAPTTHWFSLIELKNGQGGQPIKTWYNDTLFLGGTANKKMGEFPALFEGFNLDPSEKTFLGQTLPLQAGQRKTFFLTLECNIWEQLKTQWKDSNTDLCLDMKPDDSGIVISGGGAVTLNSMTLLIEGEASRPEYNLLVDAASKGLAQSSFFVDPVSIWESSHVLNVGSNLYNLNNLNGKCAGLYILLRPVGTGVSNVNNGWFQTINIGDESGASLDVLDASNKSVLGGQPLSTKHLRNERWIHSMPNPIGNAKPYYLIQFGDAFSRSFVAGEPYGFRDFNGEQTMLQINAVAAVNEVQTITCRNATNTVGTYRFLFKGELSAPLDYSATAAQMATAVQNMRTMRRNNISVVFSGVMEGTITATFTTPETNGLGGELLTVVTDSLASAAGGTQDSPVTTITTFGQDGIVNGQAYNIRCYALMWKKAIWANGTLSSEFYITKK